VRYGGLSPPQLRRVLEFMDANLHSDVQLADLAALVGVTPYHFLRSFYVEAGVTPHQWLIRRRIARAKSLLCDSSLSIAEIALAVGYGSQSAMTAAFSRLTGVSPKQWRMRRF
jgi:AraC family transcriptional regulator